MAKKKKSNAMTIAKNRGIVARNAIYDYTMEERREFLDKFIVCEVVCKTIIEYYQKETKKKQNGYITLNMKTISAAMNHFSLAIPNHILNGVFGGSGNYKKRGTKSAKKLRDGIMHAASKEDAIEVYDRRFELNDLMDDFLTYLLPKENSLEPALSAAAV